jgi:peptidoglycan/LPS O-acetylase OafA/YrhL
MTARKQYVEMDGLRGVAALSVALFHERDFLGGNSFFGHGYLAVDFFFMLSGFVLMHAYGERLQIRDSLAPYLRDRIIRLYPMLVVGSAAGLLLALATKDHDRSPIGLIAAGIANAAGLPAIWNHRPFYINEPVWSLFFEIVANVAFGIAAVWLTRGRLLLLVSLSALLMLALNYHFGFFGFGYARHTLGAGLVRVCASFSIGLFLHQLHKAGVLSNGGKRWWVAPLLVASFVAVPFSAKVSLLYDPLIVFGLYPVLILASAGSKDLFPPIATLSGALSYPFYVIHAPTIHLMEQYLIRQGIILTGATALMNIGATLLVSFLLMRWFDEPVRGYLKGALGSGQHRRALPAS